MSASNPFEHWQKLKDNAARANKELADFERGLQALLDKVTAPPSPPAAPAPVVDDKDDAITRDHTFRPRVHEWLVNNVDRYPRVRASHISVAFGVPLSRGSGVLHSLCQDGIVDRVHRGTYTLVAK